MVTSVQNIALMPHDALSGVRPGKVDSLFPISHFPNYGVGLGEGGARSLIMLK